MGDTYVTLACESCGAGLQVYEDMDHFACGFCGTAMTVQRRGGTVALRHIEAAIGRVQAGTDKTAAELAIVRYEESLKSLRAREQTLQKQQPSTASVAMGALMVCFGIALAFKVACFGMGIAVLGALMALGSPNQKQNMAALAKTRARIANTEAKLREKRAIADA